MKNELLDFNLECETLIKPMKKIKIIGNTFSKKEELKAWGCFYNADEKAWFIETDSVNSLECKAIKSMGLELEKEGE